MILLTTKNFDEEGYLEFYEDETQTRYPEVKRNVIASKTLDNQVILEDRGLDYLDSVIEIYSNDSLPLEKYFEIRRFIEKNAIFNISMLIGTYEVYKATLNIESGKAKITAQVSRIVD